MTARVLFSAVGMFALALAACSGSSSEKCPTENQCAQAAAAECSQGRLRTCRADADGCLSWGAYSDCESGSCQDASACLECNNECSAGESECDAGQVRICAEDADGCLIWGAFSDCPSGFCGDAHICGTCADPCSDGATECTNGQLRTCVVDQNGCLVWGAASACPEGFCEDAATCGACDNTCTQGDSICIDGNLTACEQDQDGCWQMGSASACPDGWCQDATTCGVCDNGCDALDQTECTADGLRTCEAAANGCLDWTPFSACPLGYCASDVQCGWLTLDETKIEPADGATAQYFGSSVAISGDTLVVGVVGDGTQGNSAGAAYIFYRDQGGPGSWGQVVKLVPADGAQMEQFGNSVAIDGDTVVVGTPYDGDNGLQSGSAYIYARDQGGPDNWGLVRKVLAADGGEYDAFGWTVSVSGDRVAVGAVFDGTFGTATGSVYLFERDNGGPDNWGQQLKIHSASPTQDWFAQSVSLDGDTLAVGAYVDDELDTDAGAAYVFDRNLGGADNWGQVAKILAPDGAHGDHFGNAVVVDGDSLVVGAPEDGDIQDRSGSAQVFGRDQDGADAWGPEAKLVASDGVEDAVFGTCVTIHQDKILVGAPFDDSGSAYLFQKRQAMADTWEQAFKLSTSLRFGYAVAADGNTLVVGAIADSNHNSAGAVFVYEITE